MLRKSLEIEERLGRVEGVAGSCYNLALIVGARGDLAAARELLAKALQLFERLRASDHVQMAQQLLDDLARLEGQSTPTAGSSD